VIHEFSEGGVPEFWIRENFTLGNNASSWHVGFPISSGFPDTARGGPALLSTM
jgi:hypothetical protein